MAARAHQAIEPSAPAARPRRFCPREPIGLGREEAAAYIGLSAGSFDKLVARGAMPAPRMAGARRLWDADELAAAFRALPKAGETADADGEADDPWSDVAV